MEHDRLTLTSLAVGMLARWREVGRVTVGVVVFALLLSVALPPVYQSIVTFVTADAGVELPRGLSDLGASPGVSGLAAQFGLGGGRDPSTSPAFYAQLLGSRELCTRLVTSRFPNPRTGLAGDSADLLAIYRIKQRDRLRGIELAIKRVKRDMAVGIDARTNFVTIVINSRWASLSEAVANRTVELVGAFNREQRLSRSRSRRVFLESRVAESQGELRAAESSLRYFYEQNRLWSSSPGLIVEERRVRRQVEMASDLYLSLRTEFESARIDEVNTTPVITIVDRAVAPRKPLWPRRTAIGVTAGFLGVGLGVLWAAARVLAANWATHRPDDAAALGAAFGRLRREVTGALRRRRTSDAPTA